MNMLLSIIALLFIAAGIVILWRVGLEGHAKQILLNLVINAEEMYGGGTGELKFSAVATWLYETMPGALHLLFSEKQIARWINDAVERMKEYLADNKAAAEYVGVVIKEEKFYSEDVLR